MKTNKGRRRALENGQDFCPASEIFDGALGLLKDSVDLADEMGFELRWLLATASRDVWGRLLGYLFLCDLFFKRIGR